MKNIKKELMEMKALLKTKNEEVINLKMERKDAMASISNFNSLQNMKADTDKVNSFIKMMIKDNMFSYKESHTPNAMDTSDTSVKVRKSILKDNSTNRYQCKCSACLVLFTESKNGNYVRMKKMAKHVEITTGCIMAVSYDSAIFDYENFPLFNNQKVIKLSTKGVNSSKIELSFTLSKSSNLKLEDLNLGLNKIIDIGPEYTKVSYSSFMIVESMRNLVSISQTEESKAFERVNVLEGINDCFVETMKELIPNMKSRENFTAFCINDLREEEEMVLLTESWDKKVYVKKFNDKSSKNHMSIESFDGSVEMWFLVDLSVYFFT